MKKVFFNLLLVSVLNLFYFGNVVFGMDNKDEDLEDAYAGGEILDPSIPTAEVTVGHYRGQVGSGGNMVGDKFLRVTADLGSRTIVSFYEQWEGSNDSVLLNFPADFLLNSPADEIGRIINETLKAYPLFGRPTISIIAAVFRAFNDEKALEIFERFSPLKINIFYVPVVVGSNVVNTFLNKETGILTLTTP